MKFPVELDEGYSSESRSFLQGHLSARPCTFSVGCQEYDFDPEEGAFTLRCEKMEAVLPHVPI